MPPLDVPDDQPDPIDPNDPCAKLEVVYFNPRIFMQYVDKVWLLPLLLLPTLVQPYRALGGIQIGGGSERVRVIENVIIGGAGNGITLGDGLTLPAEPPAPPVITIPISEVNIIGAVVDASGKGVPAAKITLTRQQDGKSVTKTADAGGKFIFTLNAGKYAVAATAKGLALDQVDLTKVLDHYYQFTIKMKAAERVPQPRAFAFLYQIAIVGQPDQRDGNVGHRHAAADLRNHWQAQPAVGRRVGASLARQSGHRPGHPAQSHPRLPAESVRRGIADRSEAARRRRHLARTVRECRDRREPRSRSNGTSAANPTCGVFMVYGEGVDITANHIVGNGPLPAGTAPTRLPGTRGGVVLLSVASFNVLAAINAGGTSNNASTALINPRPAARVHENVVDQPAGLALYIAAYGPLSCTDNSFNSELSGTNALELAAGTVLIINIGGTQVAPPSIQVKAGAAQPAPAGAEASPSSARESHAFRRNPEALALLPRGHTMFNDNQSRTGAANISATCQIIATFDDLAYQDNQSQSDRPDGVWSNAFLGGATVRATGNRLIEAGPNTPMSLFTVGSRMNDTSLNQGDHCIIAVDLNPDPAMAIVQQGNQVLYPSTLCPARQTGAVLKLRLQG